MTKDTSLFWKQALRSGLIAGGVAILVSLVGLVESFGETDIITGLVSLGELILLAPVFLFSYTFIRGAAGKSPRALAGMTALLGLVAGLLLTLLVIVGSTTNIRVMFINASPALFDMLTRGVPFPLGALVPPLQCIIAAWISLGLTLIPERFRKPVNLGILVVIVLGTLRD